jgi:hypothetical protein
MVLLPAPQPMSNTRRIDLVACTAARAINSMASGASIAADCPVSRFENRSTSLSNRFFISSGEDFCSGDQFMICLRIHVHRVIGGKNRHRPPDRMQPTQLIALRQAAASM